MDDKQRFYYLKLRMELDEILRYSADPEILISNIENFLRREKEGDFVVKIKNSN